MWDILKFIFQLKFLKQLFWVLVSCLLIFYIRDAIEFDLYLFLDLISSKQFETYFVRNSGGFELFNLLRKNGELNLDYLITIDLFISILLIIFLFLFFYFSDNVSTIFTEGKSRNTYKKISNVLFEEKRLLPYVIGIYFIINTYSCFSIFQKIFEKRANSYFRSYILQTVSPIRNNTRYEVPGCKFDFIFRHPNNFQINKIDIVFFLMGLDKSPLKAELRKLKGLNEKTPITLSESMFKFENNLNIPNKTTFTKEEVRKLIEINRKSMKRDAKDRILLSSNFSYPKLVIDRKADKSIITYQFNEDEKYLLGYVDYFCSHNESEIRSFELRRLFDGMP